MKKFTKKLNGFAFLFLFTGMFLMATSCSDDDDTVPIDQPYVCSTCTDTPDALAENDASINGIYKGITVGSTGTISINIQNGSNTITATLVLDDVSIALISTVTVVEGEPYVAPFTGTYNGNPISITFSVGLNGETPTVVTSDIPGHPDAVFEIYKETSTSLIEAFEGEFTITGGSQTETGVFNFVLSRSLEGFSGIAKTDITGETTEVYGSYNNLGQLIDEGGTIIGTITGDELHGQFSDADNDLVTLVGYRTL